MVREINLLQQRKSAGPQLVKLRRIFVQNILPVGGIYAIVFLSVLAVSFFFESRLNTLEGEQAKYIEGIISYADREHAVRQTKQQLGSIVAILENQYPFSDHLSPFVSVLKPPGVTIKSIDITADGMARVSVTATNSDVVSEFINILQSRATNYGYENIVLANSTYQKDTNMYEMDITFTIQT